MGEYALINEFWCLKRKNKKNPKLKHMAFRGIILYQEQKSLGQALYRMSQHVSFYLIAMLRISCISVVLSTFKAIIAFILKSTFKKRQNYLHSAKEETRPGAVKSHAYGRTLCELEAGLRPSSIHCSLLSTVWISWLCAGFSFSQVTKDCFPVTFWNRSRQTTVSISTWQHH